ncbi:hypothetical protein [Emticicia agri]|uniref:Uncharacterized protein n=1 Tax=Emticicia agri TaxID=2492393 RepID=A0A4Q5LXR7_9BACT|nr:hypothetical protein [Emticicia agri]RYU94425.1 hypothetical protein EWM59_16635 [Emticicia agri]
MFLSKFYKVGMISLLFIPAICIPYLKVEYKKRDFRLLKLNMPEPVYRGGWSYDYSMLDKIRKETVLKDFESNNPNLEETIYEFSKLDSNQAFLEKILVNYQYGLRIKLNHKTTYETLVKLLNACKKYKLSRYPIDLRYNEMYIFDIFNMPKEDKILQEGLLLLGNCIIIEEPESTFSQKLTETFNNYITPVAKSFNKTLIIYIGFLSIVFVAYRRGI